MSNNKQSSVEWICGKLEDLESMFNLRIVDNIQYYEEKTKLLQQAKAMHKEEIEKSWVGGKNCLSAEHYYNETFGGNDDN